MISDVIAERNRIVNGDPSPSAAAPPTHRQKKQRKKRKKAPGKSHRTVDAGDTNSGRAKMVRMWENHQQSEIKRKLKDAQVRVRKLVDQQRKKATEKSNVRLDRIKQHKKALAESVRNRAKKLQQDLLKADQIQQKIATQMAEKRAALRRKEKEKNDRAKAVRKEAELMRMKAEGKLLVKPKAKVRKTSVIMKE
jgi:hypothetical protein